MADINWVGCPRCGGEPHVINEQSLGALMGCDCGWFGWFRDCWEQVDGETDRDVSEEVAENA